MFITYNSKYNWLTCSHQKIELECNLLSLSLSLSLVRARAHARAHARALSRLPPLSLFIYLSRSLCIPAAIKRSKNLDVISKSTEACCCEPLYYIYIIYLLYFCIFFLIFNLDLFLFLFYIYILLYSKNLDAISKSTEPCCCEPCV